MSALTPNHPLVYPQSPFLPEIEKGQVLEAMSLMDKYNLPQCMAVSQVITSHANDHFEIVSKNIDFLEKYFNCDIVDVGHWLLGYSTAPYLIIGACVYLKLGLKTALDYLLPDDEGVEILIQSNLFRRNVLPVAVRSIVEFPSGLPIFDLTVLSPIFEDRYFSAGVIASRLNYTQLIQLILINTPQ